MYYIEIINKIASQYTVYTIPSSQTFPPQHRENMALPKNLPKSDPFQRGPPKPSA